jgi:hypothetical protein
MRGHGKEMMHDKAVRWFGAVISGLVCGAFVACAGSDTPPVDDSLEDAITQNFGNRAVASGGSGGSPSASRGGSGGRGGATVRPPAEPGEDDPPVASGGSAGTANPPDDDEPPPSNGACDGFAVLAASCDGGSCHGDGSSFGTFAASEADALSVVDLDASVSCSGEGPLIDPDNPRQSVIIQKVLGTASCGSPMPLTGPLDEADIECLEEWIGSL